MGCNFSFDSDAEEQSKRTLNAARNYHRRINEYRYAYHGYYTDYVEWCRGQYELECLPECCRQGVGYTQKYDEWGNEI